MKDKQRDIQDVMAEEISRGRRPVDLAERRLREEGKAGIRKLLTIGTLEEFVDAMLAYGLREGSQELSDAIEAWRSYPQP